MRARALSAEIDHLLAGSGPQQTADDQSLSEELTVAYRLQDIVASFPPVPAGLQQRVHDIICSPSAYGTSYRRSPRRWAASAAGTAVLSALATTLVFLVILMVVPVLSGGQRSWAQMIDVLLGQTRVVLTPTLHAGSTPANESSGVVRLTPEAGVLSPDAGQDRGLPLREPLSDLVAAELLIGRAPSIPKTLPQGYALLEIAAVSYPDLPSWISQPFYVELCYGSEAEGVSSDLRLRQYRLLFREFGGISSVQVASDAVKDIEQVDIKGATGMLLTLDSQSGIHTPGSVRPTFTVLWERDGLLLELETDGLSQEHLLEIARSVR